MRSRIALSLVPALAILGGISMSSAAPKGGVQMGKLSCVLVREGLVYSLDQGKSPRFYPPSIFRCSVPIVVTGEPKTLPMIMKVKQESPAITAEAAQQIQVGPGSHTAELSVAATEAMNECMGVQLTVVVGKASRDLKIAPVDCGD